MVKFGFRPTSSACRRRIFAPIEWKVPIHGMPSTTPVNSPTRSRISRAALLVKVTREDLVRPRAPRGDEMGDARGQHPRLADAGAGQHQHRPIQRLDRAALLRIEAGEIARR